MSARYNIGVHGCDDSTQLHDVELTEADDEQGSHIERYHLAKAAVHATLALAGATALQSYCGVQGSEGELADWEHAAGGDDQ